MKKRGTARIWAWVALVAAAGVLATLAVLLANDVVALLLVLAALGLAGAGLWLATTRRGIVRALGIAVAVVALAGAVVALVAQGLIDELLALAVAIAVFGAAGRRALRGDSLGRTGATQHGARPARARSAVLLINPSEAAARPSASIWRVRHASAESGRWCSSVVTTYSSWRNALCAMGRT